MSAERNAAAAAAIVDAALEAMELLGLSVEDRLDVFLVVAADFHARMLTLPRHYQETFRHLVGVASAEHQRTQRL